MIQKGGKNEEKTFKKNDVKKTSKKEAEYQIPRATLRSSKELFEDTQNTDRQPKVSEEGEWKGWV